MKNALIAILIVAVVALGVMVFMQMQRVNTLTEDVAKLKESAESNVVESKETTEITTSDTEKSTTESTTKSKKNVEFDPEKMKLAADDCTYEVEDSSNYKLDGLGLKVEVEDGKAFVSVKFVEDWTAGLYDINEEIKNQEITGFKSVPTMCFMAIAGQDISAPVLCFLMEDGTVETLDTRTAFKEEKFVSEGKLKGLENIVAFEVVSVHENSGGGFISSVAIDEDGYAYDIYEIVDR